MPSTIEANMTEYGARIEFEATVHNAARTINMALIDLKATTDLYSGEAAVIRYLLTQLKDRAEQVVAHA